MPQKTPTQKRQKEPPNRNAAGNLRNAARSLTRSAKRNPLTEMVALIPRNITPFFGVFWEHNANRQRSVFFLPAPCREAHATTTKRGNVPLFPLQMGLFYSEEHNPILPMKWGNVDPLIWYYVPQKMFLARNITPRFEEH